MNAKQLFVEWLNQSPERYGGSSFGVNGVPTILEYFLMAVEDGAFDEAGVIWLGDTIAYREQRYSHPYSTAKDYNILPFESLFQTLVGFSPRVFSVWGNNLSTVPRGKFARAIGDRLAS
jgi:hypothetical protein